MAGVVQGGNRLRAFVKKAEAARRKAPVSVEIGFFSTARYSPVRQGKRGGQKRKPLPVTVVAFWNEFGTQDAAGNVLTPERPFFRNAIENVKNDVRAVVAARVNTATMAMDTTTARLAGQMVEDAIKTEITRLRDPANEPSTIARKGSANPLIDEGFMRQSVTYRVFYGTSR